MTVSFGVIGVELEHEGIERPAQAAGEIAGRRDCATAPLPSSKHSTVQKSPSAMRTTMPIEIASGARARRTPPRAANGLEQACRPHLMHDLHQVICI